MGSQSMGRDPYSGFTKNFVMPAKANEYEYSGTDLPTRNQDK